MSFPKNTGCTASAGFIELWPVAAARGVALAAPTE
jgi:hypothetical protein